jgi:hypothetical protein
MNGSEKNIDRIFKNKLSHFDAEPPAEVWDNIKGKLYLERRRKMIFWFTRVAAGIAVLAALSLTYFIARNSIKDNLISDDKKVKTEAEEGVPLSEGKLSDGESPAEISPDLKSENRIERQEIKKEVKIAHTVFSPGYDGGPEEITFSEEFQPEHFQEPIVTSVRSKSIRRLEYEVPVMEIKPSGEGMPGKPYEEIYALNIPYEEESHANRWAVGTQVSPLYSYRNLSVKDESMETANYYNQAESGTLAYSGGLNVNYSPTRRISIQSGVYYSRYGVSVDQAYFFENAPTADAGSSAKFYSVNNSSGIIDIADNTSVDYVTNYGQHKNHMNFSSAGELSLQVNSGEVIQNFEYLEVPLVLRYRLIDRKIGLNFLGGLSTNLLVGSNTYYNEDGNKEKIGETTDIKPFNYSSIMGIGIDYAISKHLNINLEPTFRYYLNSINESSFIGSHPYSLGVFTGVRYSF